MYLFRALYKATVSFHISEFRAALLASVDTDLSVHPPFNAYHCEKSVAKSPIKLIVCDAQKIIHIFLHVDF